MCFELSGCFYISQLDRQRMVGGWSADSERMLSRVLLEESWGEGFSARKVVTQNDATPEGCRRGNYLRTVYINRIIDADTVRNALLKAVPKVGK